MGDFGLESCPEHSRRGGALGLGFIRQRLLLLDDSCEPTGEGLRGGGLVHLLEIGSPLGILGLGVVLKSE